MARDEDVVEFEDVTVKVETAAALLCVIDGDEHWIPKSHIDSASEVFDKETSGGTLVITKWIAEQRGLG